MNERIQELMIEAEQEPFDMNDHPPHRLCECRKCMEYFTPLPDCDAFVAFGKPIAEQKNIQLMEGYRIGLAEMREKCAKVCDDIGDSDNGYGCAAAIRTIKFEGDTGFRPVSEMIAEHKKDPKKAAAIEKAQEQAEQEPEVWYCPDCGTLSEAQVKCCPDWIRSRKVPKNFALTCKATFDRNEQAEQEPVAIIEKEAGFETEVYATGHADSLPDGVFKLYASPVRTKDLTDDEIYPLYPEGPMCDKDMIDFARAVIAADREKNR